ncbi:MAG: M4 family metallopeptidase [Anaerolineaceae bacterium]|nr:M4 family metallopeptidase [Anaerolineaceae bacterium]
MMSKQPDSDVFIKTARHIARLCLMVGLLWLLGQSPAAAQEENPVQPTGDATLIARLEQSGAQISYHAETGKVRFIGVATSNPIAQAIPLQAQATSEEAARNFLAYYGGLFGLRDANQELTVMRQGSADQGRSFVRFQQVYNGVPVIGGELIVQMDSHLSVLSANGEVLPDVRLSTTPTISADTARQTALESIAKVYGMDVGQLTASQPELWVYNPVLIGPGDTSTQLVWRMNVTSIELAPIEELVLINAERGSIALHFNQVDTAMNRRTYTANNTTTVPGTLVCSDPTACSTGDTHAFYAHKYAGDTYNFYLTNHGRDSIDNAGMTLVSTVHYDSGYNNAFWSSSINQMVYGDGQDYPLADDVVGHELTHGVTSRESNLFYYYQSGAINESFSDVWGEFVDLTNGSGTDDAGHRWLMGEDVSPGGNGAIRDMSDPTVFGDPDKMTSIYYYTGNGDNGGVHFNSGINNKAVYLMVDGGSFNGQTVTGLGITKVAKIYYEVQTNLLTSGADYADLNDLLYQACLNLVGTAGIVAGDCQEVQKATTAVEMDQQPIANFNTDAPLCPAGSTFEAAVFSDEIESGGGNWSTNNGSRWSFTSGYAHSGNYSLYGNDSPAAVSDSNIYMKTSVTIPENAYLHFAHVYGFETPNWDGGVLEYTTNGTTWIDAGSLIEINGYDGTVATGWSNPLAGRLAFIGESHGYISSRLDLTSLEGQNVRFRWRMGLDSVGAYLGWLIDDVQIYSCSSLSKPAGLWATPTSFTEIELTWTDQSADETEFRIERAENGGSWAQIDTVPANTTSYTDTPITCDTQYSYRVRAFRSGDGALSSYSNTASATSACSPANAAPQRNYFTTDTPTLSWNRVTGATEFEIQVDDAAGFAAPLVFTTTVPATTLTVTTSSLPNGTYFWRVRAKSGASAGAWSVVDSFIVDAP